MSKRVVFSVSVARHDVVDVDGRDHVGVRDGGEPQLLGWLETQLGLLTAKPTEPERIGRIAKALDRAHPVLLEKSRARDRWGTAKEVLRRLDELRLAGWDGTVHEDAPGTVHEDAPPLVQALAAVQQAIVAQFPDSAERLRRVLAALEQGQTLPDHEVLLAEEPEQWPALWRDVLRRLHFRVLEQDDPVGEAETALLAIQHDVLEGRSGSVAPDKSLRWLRSRSDISACETIAAALAAAPELAEETVICCENESLALLLDDSLARAGVPTMGAAITTTSHVALHVLPIALRLCWKPVDPAVLLDFLTLPISPIPRRAAGRLSSALTQQPGLGSEAWEHARAELLSEEADPEGALKARLDKWLDVERVAWGEPLPAELVATVCRRVAQWAMGRAASLDDAPELQAALRYAGGQASTVCELVEGLGHPIAEPQLLRILESTLGSGVPVRPHRALAGSPKLVSSFADVQRPFRRCIWLGLATAGLPSCRWTKAELDALAAIDVVLDDGTKSVEALRQAERRGLARITESLLAVSVPDDEDGRPHPLWLQVQSSLSKAGVEEPLALEDLLERGDTEALSPWAIASSLRALEPPQPLRIFWDPAPARPWDRQRSSASSLESRLGCPLQWVLRYNCRLAASPIARLPDEARLKGSFCHQVLERVFGQGGAPPTPDSAAVSVERCFDERIGLDAAPLAQPRAIAERLELRKNLSNATRLLVNTLRAGGYGFVGLEVAVDGELDGRALTGSIDCVVADDAGAEAVIDFKYRGVKKFPALLQEGRATQLATYAMSRAGDGSANIPKVGYLILNDVRLVTPSASAIRGATDIVDGPAIAEVWENFLTALRGADGWLTGNEPVPARPLQPPEERPPGSELVVPESIERETPSPCKYCDYSMFCGFTGVN